MVRRFFFLGFLATAAILAAARLMHTPATAGGDTPPTLKFSHKLHIETAGVECATCHEAAQTSKLSSDNLFGGKQVCAACHDVEDDAKCNTCHFENTTPVRWQPRQKDLHFPHATHVTGTPPIACATCHAGIEQAEEDAPAAYPAMATCFTCHNNSKQSNTCELCHSNFALMLPTDHRQSDFARNHGYKTRLGALTTAECQTCHTENFCQECHQGSGLKAFTERDWMTDPGPKRSTQDGPDQTVLQNAHGLNYRFTHGIDARAKQADCATCHSAQTFCVECHEAGGNISQVSFKPASHLVAGFALIGRGSGGGLHAEEARKDIESCMSCHDVDGQDPTCLTCHTESGMVR